MDAKELKDEAVENLKHAAEGIKDGAGNLFDAAKHKAEEVTKKDLDGDGKIGK